MNGMWILVAAVVAVALLRRGRQGEEKSSRFRSGFLFVLAFAFLFLFLGNRGPFRNWDSWMPNLPSIQVPEMPSPARPAAEARKVRDFLASLEHEKAEHQHVASKSAHTSSAKAFSEKTIVINEDGTEIAIAQTSRSRAPQTYRGRFIGIAGFAVAGLIVVAFLYIGYLFLDAGTRGQFSWTLRIASIVAFGVICAVVALLRQRM